MDATLLGFAAYWADPVLRADLDVLIGCGVVQRHAAERGIDNPAGWFCLAADTYTTGDPQGVMAHRACLLVSYSFSGGAAS
jgi:hypothetical protein